MSKSAYQPCGFSLARVQPVLLLCFAAAWSSVLRLMGILCSRTKGELQWETRRTSARTGCVVCLHVFGCYVWIPLCGEPEAILWDARHSRLTGMLRFLD